MTSERDVRRKGVTVVNRVGLPGSLLRRWLPAYKNWRTVRRLRAELEREADLIRRMDRLPLFKHIEIETINRCNGTCAFCPVNRDDDPRKPERMTEALFGSIVGQLAEAGYDKNISLFSNNEPLLDTRIADFAAETRAALPRAEINLFTNGLLLDVDLFRRLMAQLSYMVIDQYVDRAEMAGNIREIHEFCLGPEGRKLLEDRGVHIVFIGKGEVRTTRGGNAPNKAAPRRPLPVGCHWFFRSLSVRPDGKLSLCCNDALGRETLGDLARERLLDVWWNGERLREVRRIMLEQGRAGLALCRRCDNVPGAYFKETSGN